MSVERLDSSYLLLHEFSTFNVNIRFDSIRLGLVCLVCLKGECLHNYHTSLSLYQLLTAILFIHFTIYLFFMYYTIYIYIYICVSVCLSVCVLILYTKI